MDYRAVTGLLLAFSTFACTADSEGGLGVLSSGGLGSGRDTTGTGTGGATGTDTGDLPPDSLDIETDEGSLPNATGCGEIEAEVGAVPVSILIVIDRSGSMNDELQVGGTETRWDSVRNALFDPDDGVVAVLERDVKFGMTLYSAQASSEDCPLLTEVAPAYRNLDTMVTEFPGSPLSGGTTPTGEALTVAAETFANIDDGTGKAIVLATDGEPDTCEVTGVGAESQGRQASLDAVEGAFDLGIRTYVISLASEVSKPHLQDLANAGVGNVTSDAPFYEANNPVQLESAFQRIIDSFVPCEFKITGEVDLERACEGRVVLDGQELECNEDWLVRDESELVLLGPSCEALQGGEAELRVTFPCDVLIVG